MMNVSLLRYPGGKAAMSSLLIQIRKLNELGDKRMVEPFGGGAGASLKLLFLEEVTEIHINDADPAIFDLWYAALCRTRELTNLIRTANLSVREWNRQRDIYRSHGGVSRINRAFATFYLNRCNRSGIIMNGGPIGGIEQKGKWKIDARFNKDELIKRAEKIAEYRTRIRATGVDGMALINKCDPDRTFLFIDPPYFEKGKTLYLNSLNEEYHAKLAETLQARSRAAWVLTYDDCPEIRKFYQGWTKIRPFSLRYAASERRNGREIMIVPKWMRLPASQTSASIGW
jgi:DNA adenine methylase